MKKMLLISLGLLCVAGAAFAGLNSGTQAWLSWSPTAQVLDASPLAQNNLYVRLTRTGGLTFKGAEVDVTWDPAGDYLGCFDHIGTAYKTSLGATCTYLNRGTVVPVTTVDDPSHFHAAWASNLYLTGCTAGAAIQIQYQTDACVDPTGCFSLNSAIIVDSQNLQDQCSISNAVVTVSGGGTHHCTQAVPVQSTTWGHVKNLYTR